MRLLMPALLVFVSGSIASAAMAGGGVQAGGPGVQGQDGNQTWQPPAPASVVATVYDVVMTDGSTKRLARLAFHAKDVSSDYFGRWHLESLPFTEKALSPTDVEVTATLTDSAGNSLTLAATGKADSISGTITTTRKGTDAHVVSFIGGKVGSAEAKAAVAEVQSAASMKRK